MTKHDSIEQKSKRGTLRLSIVSVVKTIFQVIALGILARILEPIDFGIISTGVLIVAFSSIFSQFGINKSLIQIHQITNRHKQSAFMFSFLNGILFFAALTIFAPSLAIFFREPLLERILPILALVLPLQGLSLVSQSILNRNLQFGRLALVDFFSYLCGRIFISIYLAIQGYGIWALAISILATEIFSTCLLLWLTKASFKPLFNLSAMKELLFLGGGFALSRLGNTIALQGDYFIISKTLGVASLGVYEKAYHILVSPLYMFGDAMEKVLFSASAKMQNEQQRLLNSFIKTTTLTAFVTLPIASVIFVLAPEIIHVLLGPKWDGVITPLQILSVSMLFRVESRISNSIASGMGKSYQLSCIQWIYAVTILLFSYIGTNWGINGSATGVILAITINFVLGLLLGLSILNLTWKSVFTYHYPGLRLAAFTLAGSVFFAAILRYFMFYPWAVLLLSIVGISIVLMFLLYYNSALILGKENFWIITLILSFLPQIIVKSSFVKKFVSSQN